MSRKKKADEPLPDYPKVKHAPAGYPHLLGMPGNTWYARAKAYEKKYGKRVEKVEKNG